MVNNKLTSALSGFLQAAKMNLGGADTSVNCLINSSPRPRLAPVTRIDLIAISFDIILV